MKLFKLSSWRYDLVAVTVWFGLSTIASSDRCFFGRGFMRRSRAGLSFFLTLLLGACGGGATDTSTNDASFDLKAGQSFWVSSPQSFTATAKNGADTYQLFISAAPQADLFFEGATRKRVEQSMTVRRNGVAVIATSYMAYFDADNLMTVGAQYLGGAYMLSTTSAPALPTAAKIGASGSLGAQTLYFDSSKSTVLGRQTANWTLESAESGNAFYCVNSSLTNAGNGAVTTSVGCNKIDVNGRILGIRWTLATDGLTLTFQ